MVIAILVVLGLMWGSFVNALVWRLHESEKAGRRTRNAAKNDLSILNGRSMCPNCRHTLAASDLVPIISWLTLGGRCRYCKKPISVQYPIVEAITAIVFVVSYLFWPLVLASAASIAIFGLWLVLVVILVALAVYDFRWQLLPDRLTIILAVVAIVQAALVIATASSPVSSIIEHIAGIAIGGGVFYLIFVISRGNWIGGGDVKLGFVLGLMAGSWGASLLMLFLAALAGSLVSVPLMVAGKLGRKSVVPFGPFLIIATVIVVIWGGRIIDWYTSLIRVG